VLCLLIALALLRWLEGVGVPCLFVALSLLRWLGGVGVAPPKADDQPLLRPRAPAFLVQLVGLRDTMPIGRPAERGSRGGRCVGGQRE